MTRFTKDGKRLVQEHFVAIYVFHAIFGYFYKPECEEANELDRTLLDDPNFVNDIYAAIHSLPEPCGKVLLERLALKSYKEIAKELGIKVIMAQEHEHTAWRLIRRLERTKALRHYTYGFKKWEEEMEGED